MLVQEQEEKGREHHQLAYGVNKTQNYRPRTMCNNWCSPGFSTKNHLSTVLSNSKIHFYEFCHKCQNSIFRHPSQKATNQDEFQHQINRIGPLKQWIADLMKSDTRNGNCHILESFFVKACLKTLKGSSILFDLKRPHARAKNRKKWFSISLANQSLGSLDCNILRDGSLEEVMTSGRWSENQGGFLRVFGSISTQ